MFCDNISEDPSLYYPLPCYFGRFEGNGELRELNIVPHHRLLTNLLAGTFRTKEKV